MKTHGMSTDCPAGLVRFVLAALVFCVWAEPCRAADSSSGIKGGKTTVDPLPAALIVDHYDKLLKTRDVAEFQASISSRYTEATLVRLTSASDVRARRAAVVALGLTGTYASNAAVGKMLKDPDQIVRGQAVAALWSIWYRADTPENNTELDEIRKLIGEDKLDIAIGRLTALTNRAKGFAEAYNQRAIARFLKGDYAGSIEDCRKVIELNPYHFGAFSGMGQCQIHLRQFKDAAETFRRASKIQPFDENLKDMAEELDRIQD